MKRSTLNTAALAAVAAVAMFCAACNGKGTAVGDERWAGDVDRLMEMFNAKHGFPPKDTTPNVVTPPVTPPDTTPTVVTPPDSGGSYAYVELGGLKWMKKNLNVVTEDSWCYNDNNYNCDKDGRLYTWEAAKSACQLVGWRLPTRQEWSDLVTAVGSPAGTKLKSKTGWSDYSDSYVGTDEFGFSALPGGYRGTDGNFYNVVYYGYWWTASGVGSGLAYRRYMSYSYYGVYERSNGVGNGLSVRCVKD